jgi:hypothetical protein
VDGENGAQGSYKGNPGFSGGGSTDRFQPQGHEAFISLGSGGNSPGRGGTGTNGEGWSSGSPVGNLRGIGFANSSIKGRVSVNQKLRPRLDD